ncbi:hypothetical protein B0H16DRAFT_1703312 [Mycena metata]|uniref:Uncharacterized protein n=1 Tax=Mycena metata TaxID=1033252 RepID=A0AAD7MDM0_9AGAR|nr:hypothetical protein B0H16DRAFT_1703312 [Mycena metata]
MNLNDVHASESEQAWVAKDRWEARGASTELRCPANVRQHGEEKIAWRKGICWRSATGYWVEGGRYMSVRVRIQTTPAILCARNGAAEEGGITKQIVRRSLQSWRIKIPAWWERNLDTRRGRGVTVLIQIEGAHKGRAAVAEGIAQSQVMWSPEAEGQHKERDGGERVVLVQGQEEKEEGPERPGGKEYAPQFVTISPPTQRILSSATPLLLVVYVATATISAHLCPSLPTLPPTPASEKTVKVKDHVRKTPIPSFLSHLTQLNALKKIASFAGAITTRCQSLERYERLARLNEGNQNSGRLGQDAGALSI